MVLPVKIVVGIYAVYWTVGLGLKVFGVEPPFGAFADFLFIFFAAVVVFALESLAVGWRRALGLFCWIAVASAVVETVGTLTGVPFGAYYYTANFGPDIGGVLPWAIPLAWWIVLMPIWRLLRCDTCSSLGAVTAVVLTACFAVAVDLVIEPMAVVVKEYWVWSGDGFYYGVPFSNFVGWWLTALALAAVLPRWAGSVKTPAIIRSHAGLLLSVLVFFAVNLAAAGGAQFVFPIGLAIGLSIVACLLACGGAAEAEKKV